MARLIEAVEAEFETDYAVLSLAQESGGGGFPGGFVGTVPGGVDAQCGTKYARVKARAERWDARPPLQRGWEDIDEWPFEEIPGGGPLGLSGFDPQDVGLDVEGLGRARVVVYARGRQRYGYFELSDPLEPEEWLFQVFPDPERLDALAGDPRRLSGRAPFSPPPRTGWYAARDA